MHCLLPGCTGEDGCQRFPGGPSAIFALTRQPPQRKTPTTTCRRRTRRRELAAPSVADAVTPSHRLYRSGIVDQVDQTSRSSRAGAKSGCRAVHPTTARRSIPTPIEELPRSHSPSLRAPTGAHFSQSSTMPATLCKDIYLSAVMKVPSSRGSCTSRSHPHFSHASDIHWAGSKLVVMPASCQNLARRRDPLALASCATHPVRRRFATSLARLTKNAGRELL